MTEREEGQESRLSFTDLSVAEVERLVVLVESSGDAIATTDLDGIVTSWNKAAEDLFQFPAVEIIGRSIKCIVPVALHAEGNAILARLRQGNGIVRQETQRQTKDGRLLDVAFTASPLRGKDGRIRGGSKIMRDITPQKQRERELARLLRLFEALREIHQVIAGTTTRRELLERICQALVEQAGFALSCVGWYDLEKRLLVPVAVWGDDSGTLLAIQARVQEHPEQRGPIARALDEGRPYFCNDVLSDPATLLWREEATRRDFRAVAALPIRQGGAAHGVLTVFARERDCFQDKEVALLTQVVKDLAFALDNLTREEARRVAEASLRAERDFSDAALNSLPGVFYVYDSEMRFLRWNRNFERVSGYSGDEIAAMQPRDFFATHEHALLAERIAEVFERGESSVEAGFVAKDGSSTSYHFTGVRAEISGQIGVVGVGIDVSERVRAQAALAASEARYRTLFEHMPDGILIGDRQSYYLDANASMCNMLGYTRQELIGMHASDIVVADERPQVEEAIGVINAGDVFSRELKFRRKDGSVFPTEVLGTQLPDGNMFGVIRDISERKRAEGTLRELNETLEEKVKQRTLALNEAKEQADAANRAKGAFLAHMSHEIRTPMNAILGFGQLMQRDSELSPRDRDRLGKMMASGFHLLDLINNVLEMSKIEAKKISLSSSVFDLHAAVSAVADMVRGTLEQKGLHLTIVGLEALPRYAQSDATKLRQILLNLLSNAAKFTHEGGVTLRSTVVAMTDPGRPRVRFEVEDTGVGISEAELKLVFEPFSQTHSGRSNTHAGTGLGAAISREFARFLGGELLVKSELGHGTTFVLELPLTLGSESDADHNSELDHEIVSLAPGQGPIKVLVVDDEPNNREVLRDLLALARVEVVEAEDGLSASEAFARTRPDLVFMDVKMPRVNGVEATAHIRATQPGKTVPIVMLSASVFREERESVLATGANDFITKPFKEATIWRALERHLGLRLVRKPSDSAPPAEAAPTRETVAALGPDTVATLRDAVESGYLSRVPQILANVDVEHQQTAARILKLAENFEIEALLRLLEG